jgi:hypothetical protein
MWRQNFDIDDDGLEGRLGRQARVLRWSCGAVEMGGGEEGEVGG